MEQDAAAAAAAAAATSAADWPAADKFVEAQGLLDKNVVLITQINDNHAVRTPEALQRNVLLIRELNANMQDVAKLYQELSSVVTGSPQPSQPAAGAAGAAAAAGAGAGAGAASGQQK